MLEQVKPIFAIGFNKCGLESIGYLIMALCFGMFFLRSTQKKRFHLISAGCYVLFFAGLFRIFFPMLSLFNPNFQFSAAGEQLWQIVFISLATALFWTSFFVSSFVGFILFLLSVSLFIVQGAVLYLLQSHFPEYNLAYWLLSCSWGMLGFSFFGGQSTGKTSLFHVIGLSIFTLALYYFIQGFNQDLGLGWFPLIIFGGVSVVVLIAELKFMESTCKSFEETLENEKRKRTMFWDIAPFPILISKLLDDTVLYINPMAREVLKVQKEEIPHFHLKDYFMEGKKRDELIELARQQKIVDGFEVKMKSPQSGDIFWLDLSARVVELDGELALYMNLQNVTDQKEKEEKLFQQASTDALTGLYNRRQFEVMSGMALANCIRQKRPYCMLMLDIDHFKKVNDTYGHDAGDSVLKHVANVLNKTHREADIVARFGGEEFVVFLNNANVEGAKTAAERIRTAVEKEVIMVGDAQVPITISLGISASQNGDIYAMIKEADTALYHSKKTGRNRSSVFSETMKEEGKKE